MTAIFAMVLTFVLVVGLHEGGHALAAIWCGVKIKRIAMGFGKPLFRWKAKKGCEWVWGIWPLGGYVQLLNTRIESVPEADYVRCFDKKPVSCRVFVLLAGAIANLLVAWLALTLFFMLGYQQMAPVVKAVSPNSIAAIAKIEAKDRIIEVGGQITPSWQAVGMRFLTQLGRSPVPVKVLAPNGSVRQVDLNLKNVRFIKNASLLAQLGFIPSVAPIHSEQVSGKSFFVALKQAILLSVQLLTFFLLMLKQLITGAISFTMLLGPISLLAVSVGSFLQGLSMYLYFIASLSLVVGLVNLFPLPTLDGGSIMYALIEKIRGRPVSVALEILLHRLTLIVLLIVLMHLLMNDVQRYLQLN